MSNPNKLYQYEVEFAALVHIDLIIGKKIIQSTKMLTETEVELEFKKIDSRIKWCKLKLIN